MCVALCRVYKRIRKCDKNNETEETHQTTPKKPHHACWWTRTWSEENEDDEENDEAESGTAVFGSAVAVITLWKHRRNRTKKKRKEKKRKKKNAVNSEVDNKHRSSSGTNSRYVSIIVFYSFSVRYFSLLLILHWSFSFLNMASIASFLLLVSTSFHIEKNIKKESEDDWI